MMRLATSDAGKGLPSPTAPAPPLWVRELFQNTVSERERGSAGLDLRVTRASGASGVHLVEAVVACAGSLDDRAFRLAVEQTYIGISRVLRSRGLFPLRFWNYVPDINRRSPGATSRYEVFNVGRYLGFAVWHGARDFARFLPAASAVGHRGEDLVVQALAARRPGEPVDNPRQISPYRYSRRYGPLPPCFARATRFGPWRGHERVAIVAGTASIVGEDARHPELLDRQLHETLLNLASISDAASGSLTEPSERSSFRPPSGRALSRYRQLRAYVVRSSDAERVLESIRALLPDLEGVELVAADLCRPELLVEVEGLLYSTPSRRPYRVSDAP
jgi:chorismate lyase/3-hydroxybenzoate synthase